MAENSMALIELMQKADGGDFLRSLAEAVLQLLMEADVDGLIGASRHERSPERVSYRNGYRDRSLDTRVGSLQLRIPKLRQGKLLSALPGATQDQRTCLGGRHPGGLDRRHINATRGRSRSGHGAFRHLEIPGVQAVQGH